LRRYIRQLDLRRLVTSDNEVGWRYTDLCCNAGASYPRAHTHMTYDHQDRDLIWRHASL
jgi:hypothetical protein